MTPASKKSFRLPQQGGFNDMRATGIASRCVSRSDPPFEEGLFMKTFSVGTKYTR